MLDLRNVTSSGIPNELLNSQIWLIWGSNKYFNRFVDNISVFETMWVFIEDRQDPTFSLQWIGSSLRITFQHCLPIWKHVHRRDYLETLHLVTDENLEDQLPQLSSWMKLFFFYKMGHQIKPLLAVFILVCGQRFFPHHFHHHSC